MTASTARKVVLVTGGGDLDPVELTGAFRAGLASSALRDRPVLALRWDGSALTGAGGPSAGVVIRETHAPDGSVETTVLALDHPCLSCAIREDLVVALEETGARYPGSHVVVLLPPGADTAGARSALKLAGGALDAVHAATTSVLHRPMLLADVGVDSTLIERGWQLMPGDDTGVADALLRQIESADTLLLIGKAGDAPVEQALLGWLAPDATWLSCLSLAHVPGTLAAFTVPSAPAEPGWLRLLQTHDAELGERGHLVLHDRGVGCLLWRARGPVHPQRLHDAMPALMTAACAAAAISGYPRGQRNASAGTTPASGCGYATITAGSPPTGPSAGSGCRRSSAAGSTRTGTHATGTASKNWSSSAWTTATARRPGTWSRCWRNASSTTTTRPRPWTGPAHWRIPSPTT